MIVPEPAMIDPKLFVLFVLASLALNITPGPDILYVLASGIRGGRQHGVIAALGIGAGGLVHALLAALGLSALLVSSAYAFSAVKYVGAAYLLAIGLKALVGAKRDVAIPMGPAEESASARHAFQRGVITAVLNPKVAIFFLAFVPQFVDPARGHVAAQFLVLGIVFCISGTVVNAAVGWLSGSARRLLEVHAGASRALDRATGAIFVALGIRLALVSRP